MRKCYLIFCILLFFTETLNAATWIEFDRSSKSIYYFDKDGIDSYLASVSNNYLSGEPCQIWTKAEFVTGVNGKALWEFDFKEKKVRVLTQTIYSKDGVILKANSTPSIWDYIYPDTIANQIFLYVKSQSKFSD